MQPLLPVLADRSAFGSKAVKLFAAVPRLMAFTARTPAPQDSNSQRARQPDSQAARQPGSQEASQAASQAARQPGSQEANQQASQAARQLSDADGPTRSSANPNADPGISYHWYSQRKADLAKFVDADPRHVLVTRPPASRAGCMSRDVYCRSLRQGG